MNENTNIDWTEWVKENDPETYYFNNDVCLPFEMMADAMTEVLDAVDVKELMKRVGAEKLNEWKETLKVIRQELVACIPNYNPRQFRHDENGKMRID